MWLPRKGLVKGPLTELYSNSARRKSQSRQISRYLGETHLFVYLLRNTQSAISKRATE